ncbi:methyltransferase, putative [Oceanicola granulosus HTCC2516]|uniref:Methyltransferase, putative n=1 Tax=Oceanicola granulosus (strain ATCC BAA-861 / DSM 15982 / KCTC 12143 / HTCC2516) TaxID=314256 RepID=Q2CC23_OCEGH|nr:class I SAM-dependent methyltransferase [Oceanicola granulosus]EAR50258.1 methyltransferase, putative [Oceanicola granulosus HTCC2516]
MTDGWDEYASSWDDRPDSKLYAEKAFASLVAQTDLRGVGWTSKRVLDFGCGTGLLAQKVAPYVGELIAVDTSEKMIAVLQSKEIPNVVAVHGNILGADHKSDDTDLGAGFDLIYASSVCGFLPDYEGAVNEFARLLRSGGHFIQWDWQASDGEEFGLSESKIRRVLESAKFRSIRVEQVFSLEADEQTMPVLIGAGIV